MFYMQLLNQLEQCLRQFVSLLFCCRSLAEIQFVFVLSLSAFYTFTCVQLMLYKLSFKQIFVYFVWLALRCPMPFNNRIEFHNNCIVYLLIHFRTKNFFNCFWSGFQNGRRRTNKSERKSIRLLLLMLPQNHNVINNMVTKYWSGSIEKHYRVVLDGACVWPRNILLFFPIKMA